MIEERLAAVLFIKMSHGHHSLVPQLIIHGEVEESFPMSHRVLLVYCIDDLPIFQTLIKKATKYQLPVELTVQVPPRIHPEHGYDKCGLCFDPSQWCNDEWWEETLVIEEE
jgi:hypothetical protein